MTLQDAQNEATAWVVARKDAILTRMMDCIAEDPRKCHTSWAASFLPNTDPADSQLATVPLNDPGRLITTPCGSCYVDEGKFSQAGITIPASAPINFRTDVAHSPKGWGAQLRVRIKFDGTEYERTFGIGVMVSQDWYPIEAQS